MEITLSGSGKREVTILNVTFKFFMERNDLCNALKVANLELDKELRDAQIKKVINKYIQTGLISEAQKALELLSPQKREEYQHLKEAS